MHFFFGCCSILFLKETVTSRGLTWENNMYKLKRSVNKPIKYSKSTTKRPNALLVELGLILSDSGMSLFSEEMRLFRVVSGKLIKKLKARNK